MISHRVKLALDRLGLLGVGFALLARYRSARLSMLGSGTPAELEDGLPVPPARLLIGIGGATTPAAYLHGGMAVARAVRELLARHGVSIGDSGALLDFGCGCGRVIRRFRDLAPAVELHGSDYDQAQVEWCRRHLPFATFASNQLAPPLPYPDATFGVVYAFSVFTHLPNDLQVAWTRELARVTRPGGHAVLTVHSAEAGRESGPLSVAEQRRFDSGEFVIRYESVAG